MLRILGRRQADPRDMGVLVVPEAPQAFLAGWMITDKTDIAMASGGNVVKFWEPGSRPNRSHPSQNACERSSQAFV